tara:strand:- start:400 stop:1098 length:699 start_codon:yes stop_codon:yes gene_type:complete
MPALSVVIPTLNEEEFLPKLLQQLQKWNIDIEILIVDGGSCDTTVSIAKEFGANVITASKGRALQMNLAAQKAKSPYLFFIHADTQLSKNVEAKVLRFIQSKNAAANFKLKFDDEHWWLALQAFFSRFRSLIFQFGDQGLLVKATLFHKLGGFNEKMILLEDQDFIRRIRKVSKIKKLDAFLITSARKYLKHGRFKLQFLYYKLYFLYRLGYSQEVLQQILESALSESDKAQ